MLFPVRNEDIDKCKFTSKFGNRVHPITGKYSMHRGIDIGMPVGTPLQALDDGTVLYSKTNGGGVTTGYGHYLVVKYGNGLTALYAHLKELSKYKAGQKVVKGHTIAFSGSTGASTGPHLHLELHENGFLFGSQVKGKDTATDPVKYYPQLEGLIGKSLKDVNFNEVNNDMEVVNFTEKWQGNLLIQTLERLRDKGVLNNADDWVKKAKNKTLTVQELALLALVMADRD